MSRILIVDDEKEIRDVIREYSLFNDYDVLEAENGFEAVNAVKNNDVDIIIMDVMMPGLDGFEATGALLCIEAAIPYSIYEITEQEFIDKIVARYLDPATPSYSTVMETSNYSIKFTSEKHPEFYYSLVLVCDVDGTYIHDRMTGRYIDMGDLFDEYDLYDLDEDYEG